MLIHKLCKDVLTLSCFTCVQNEVVLSNGSLFILQATAEIAGSYQCNGYYNDESLNSTTYHVSIAQGNDYIDQCHTLTIMLNSMLADVELAYNY